MIDLEERHLTEVRRILRQHLPDCEVRVFGSRVDGSARRYSDLDLALASVSPLEATDVEALRDAFAESDLPISVDVLDWRDLPKTFLDAIGTGYEVIQKGADTAATKDNA